MRERPAHGSTNNFAPNYESPNTTTLTRQVYNGPRVVKFISAKSKKFWVKNDF